MTTQTETQTKSQDTAQLEHWLTDVGDFTFNLADSHESKKLPKYAAVSKDAVENRAAEIRKELENSGKTAAYHRERQNLWLDLWMHEQAISALQELVEEDASPSPRELQTKMDNKINDLEILFMQEMRRTMKKQRPVEQAIRTLYSFFEETKQNGAAEHVYMVNAWASEDNTYPLEGELPLDTLIDDPDLGHPFFDDLSNEGIITRPLAQTVHVPDMAAVLVLDTEFSGKRMCDNWSDWSNKISAITFANVASEYCGPKMVWKRSSAREIREKFTDASSNYRSLALVTNPLLVREITKYEEEHLYIKPAFALAGKQYQAKTGAPIHIDDDAMGDWCLGVACPAIAHHNQDIRELNVIFARSATGDARNYHFNDVKSAINSHREPYTSALGINLLMRNVQHYLLKAKRKVDESDEKFTQRLGKELNRKLRVLTGGQGHPAIFEKCELVEADSRVIREQNEDGTLTGKIYQNHHIIVTLNRFLQDSKVKIEIS